MPPDIQTLEAQAAALIAEARTVADTETAMRLFSEASRHLTEAEVRGWTTGR